MGYAWWGDLEIWKKVYGEDAKCSCRAFTGSKNRMKSHISIMIIAYSITTITTITRFAGAGLVQETAEHRGANVLVVTSRRLCRESLKMLAQSHAKPRAPIFQVNPCQVCRPCEVGGNQILKFIDFSIRPRHVFLVRGFVYSMYHAAGPKHPVRTWSYQV